MGANIYYKLVQQVARLLVSFWTSFWNILRGVKIDSKRGPKTGPVCEPAPSGGVWESPKRKINERGEKGTLLGIYQQKKGRDVFSKVFKAFRDVFV